MNVLLNSVDLKAYLQQLAEARSQFRAALSDEEWERRSSVIAQNIRAVADAKKCDAVEAAGYLADITDEAEHLSEGERSTLKAFYDMVALDMMGPDFVASLLNE